VETIYSLNLFGLCPRVQSGCVAHPASLLSNGYRGLFSGSNVAEE